MVSKQILAVGAFAVLLVGVIAALSLAGRKQSAATPEKTAPAAMTDGERFSYLDQAPDDALVAIAVKRRDLLTALSKEDLLDCTEQYYGDFAVGELASLPSGSRSLAQQHRVLMLAAVDAAKQKPVTRRPFDLSLNDEIAEKLKASGVSERRMALAEGVPPQSDAEACDAGVLVYGAVSSLPPDRAAQWMAKVVSNAARHRKAIEQKKLMETPSNAAFAAAVKTSSSAQFERLIDVEIYRENGAPAIADRLQAKLLSEITAAQAKYMPSNPPGQR